MTIHCVVGGAYGSEAKGSVTAYLAKQLRGKITNVRVGGPNAGHTAYAADGVAWAMRQVPIGAVTNLGARLIIAAGSEIDIDVLNHEVTSLEAAGIPVAERLLIDIEATIIDTEHKMLEAELRSSIGSTAKGIGAARAARLMRKARRAQDVADLLPGKVIDTQQYLRNISRYTDQQIIIEGTQGFALGLHAGHYPYCTAGNCRNIDMLGQTGLVPRNDMHTWIVYRTYPIRVAGNSGPMANELTWEQLAGRTNGYIKPEKTTVTKLIRRVAEWDGTMSRRAIEANGGTGEKMHPCLMFVDYIDPALANTTSIGNVALSTKAHIFEQMRRDVGQHFDLFGTGPDTIVYARNPNKI